MLRQTIEINFRRNILCSFFLCCLSTGLVQAQVSLKSGLEAVQDRFGVYILYNSDELSNKEIDRKVLASDAETSLSAILTPFDLDYKKIGDQLYVVIQKVKKGTLTGVVKDEYGFALPKATVYVPLLQKGLYTDMNGRFEIELPVGKHLIEASYVGFGNMSIEEEVLASTTRDITITLNEEVVLNQVVVIGSVLSPQKAFCNTVSTEVIDLSSSLIPDFTNLNQALNFAIPSFYSVEQSISDGTDHVKPISFKGLDPGKVMVLINGKRRHNTALVHVNGTAGRGTVGVDLSAIPQNMIEKIEILKNEASSIYGSEAISGLINFKLRENTGKTEFKSTVGLSQAGDGFVWHSNVNIGTAIKEKGFLNVNLDFELEDPVNRSGDYTGLIFGDERDEDPEMVNAFFDEAGLGGRRVMSVGRAGSSKAGFFYNMAYPLNNRTKLYSFGGASFKESASTGFYRFPYQRRKQSGLYKFGFLPVLKARVLDFSNVIGVRGKRNDWDFDISQSFGQNSIKFLVENSNNASLGISSPTEVLAGSFNYFQNLVDIEIKRELDFMPLGISFSAQLRTEGFTQQAGEEASYINGEALTSDGLPKAGGIQVYPGFHPRNSVERIRSIFSISSAFEYNPSSRWRFNFYGRIGYNQQYNWNFGARLSSRYELAENHILRGGLSYGYKLPAMPQLYRGNQSSQFFLESDRPENTIISHLNASNPLRHELGVPDLEPERTNSIDLEYAMLLDDNLTLSVSSYLLKVNRKIVLTSPIRKDYSEEVAAIFKPLEIEAAQLFVNATSTLTRGIEFAGQYRNTFRGIQYHGRLAASLFQTRLERGANGDVLINFSPILDPIKEYVFTREEVARIEYSQPNSGLSFTNLFTKGKWSLMLRTTRFGAVTYIHPQDGDPGNWLVNEFTGVRESRDQVFAQKWIFDTEVSYTYNHFFNIKLGINNIFNTLPDKIAHSADTNDGVFLYSRRVQQFGVVGAFYYTTFSITF